MNKKTEFSASEPFARRLGAYTAGILGATVPLGHAAVVSNFGSFTVNPGNAPVAWNIDGDADVEFNLIATGDPLGGNGGMRMAANTAGAGALGTASVFGGDRVASLPAGSVVSAGNAYGFKANPFFQFSSGGGLFDYGLASGNHNIGFRFVDAGASTLFGWANLDLNRALASITINDWHYESSGAAFAVGALTAVTPAPASLALLASGAAGLAALRRRRKQRTAESTADAVPA